MSPRKFSALRNPVITATIGCMFLLAAAEASAHRTGLYQIGSEAFAISVGTRWIDYVFQVDELQVLRVAVAHADASSSALPDFSSARTRFATDLQETLQVEIISGDERKTLRLHKSEPPDMPSAIFAFIPTTVAPYTVRLWGTLNAVPVDIQIPCNPAGHISSIQSENRASRELSTQVTQFFTTGSLPCPQSRSALMVPEVGTSDGTVYQLEDRVDQARKELAELRSPVTSTRLIAIVGAGLGAVALALALAAMWRTRTKNQLPY